jgi:hypothetical protein
MRVGLEDAVYLSPGQLATSNAEMVAKARRIVEDLRGAIATTEEARRIVGLPPHSAKNVAQEHAMNVTTGVAGAESNDIVEATCVRLNAKAADAASITPVIERRILSRRPEEVVVAIEAAGVNPSDVKAATGLMPYAVFPRTPGRDFSGVVVDGTREWMGKAVFGTSGDLGIRRVERTPRISSSKQPRWSKHPPPFLWTRRRESECRS